VTGRLNTWPIAHQHNQSRACVTSRGRTFTERQRAEPSLGEWATRLARMPGCDRTLRVRREISTVGSMLAFGDALMVVVPFTELRILQTGDGGAGP